MDCIVHGVTKSRTRLSNFLLLSICQGCQILQVFVVLAVFWMLHLHVLGIIWDTGKPFNILLKMYIFFPTTLWRDFTINSFLATETFPRIMTLGTYVMGCTPFLMSYCIIAIDLVSLKLLWWLNWWRIHLQCGRHRFNSWVGKIPWGRERLPTPVFWPGEFHRLYSPWGSKELDMT